MKRRILVPIALACLVTSCDRDSQSEAASSGELSKGQRPSQSSIADGGRQERSNGSSVRNSYAEEHWETPAEPENEWTEEFEAAGTPAAKIAVVERKQSSGPELLAPLIRRSLRESDEVVRQEAVKMISAFAGVSGAVRGSPGSGAGRRSGGPVDPSPGEGDETDPGALAEEAIDLVVGAAHDPSSEVRILAMEAAVELHPEAQIEIYKKTIEGPHQEVQEMTITELGRMMSKPAFDVLISGLKNPDPEFRGSVNSEVNILVNRRFESFDEAKAWWDGNLQRFTDNMIEIGGRK